MTLKASTPLDCVAWARRVNSRWIVHHNLNRNTEMYLDHLARTDPQRLASSCRHAYLMAEWCDPMEDPKPWFYSGLFSLATPEEAGSFLANHWLTRLVIGSAKVVSANSPESMAETTFGRIQRIRMALTKLPPPS